MGQEPQCSGKGGAGGKDQDDSGRSGTGAKLEEGRTWTMDAAGLEQILGLPPWARQGEQAAK